jgi:hypothetical protein
LLDLLSELLQLGITNAEHLGATFFLFTSAFHAPLQKLVFSIVVVSKRSRVQIEQSRPAEYSRLTALPRCHAGSGLGKYPVHGR